MKEIIKEIELHSLALPDYIQQEVLDFIKFKESRLEAGRGEVSFLSESALSDWNNDEEEAAWENFQ